MTSYKQSGVDIHAGVAFVEEIKGLVDQTRRPEVLGRLGGFAGLFALKKYKEPVLVSATDGVGTKILLANQLRRWEGLGQDLVAMCVNDIGCCGAEPLFFLDYLAAAKLERSVLTEVVAGVSRACQEVGCALLGGETAEMPGVYPPGEFDCAGFAVGVVEKREIIDGQSITPGDAVIGVASSGFHSNGFSLVRKILSENKMNIDRTLGETLLQPTVLYTPLLLNLKNKVTLKGIAHITGGGLALNPPRVLPAGTEIEIKKGSWEVPQVMEMFREKGALEEEEFYRVFNAGVGLVLIVDEKEKGKTLERIAAKGYKAWAIGKVKVSQKPKVTFVA